MALGPHATASSRNTVLAVAMASGVSLVMCCSPAAPVPRAAPVASSAELTEEGLQSDAPRWRYHPPEVAPIRDGLRLADGSWLLVGERGERWRTVPAADDRRAPAPPADELPSLLADAAATRLPETIDSVVAAGTSRWIFVGVSGTVYGADDPLGPCTITTRPAVPMTRLVSARQGLIGLAANGSAYRYVEGGSWSRIQTSGHRLFDVAATGEGSLLALTVPETLLSSGDGGQSWSVLTGATPMGAQRLLRAAAGGVIVAGALESAYWDGHGDRLERPTQRKPAQLPAEHGLFLARRGPRAGSVAERRAAMSAGRYWEAVETEEEPSVTELFGMTRSGALMSDEELEGTPIRWLWSTGSLGGPLELRPLPMAKRCESIRLGAAGQRVVVACVRFGDSGDDVLVEVYRSDDDGRHWTSRDTLAGLDTELVSVAVAPDGSALIGGVCRQPGKPCSPRAPLRLSPDGRRVDVSQAADLVDAPRRLVFSVDGGSAYFLGRRAKDELVALFVSADGGRSFSPQTLHHDGRGESAGGDEPWDLSDELPERSLHPGADGQLGAVLQLEPPTYVVFDRDGRITRVPDLPADTLAVSGAGARILALGLGQDGAHRSELRAWESLDGGLSFSPIAVAPGLRLDDVDPLAVQCSTDGCIIGDMATRIGWGASGTPPAEPLRLIEERARATEPAVQTPIECTVDDRRGWDTLRDIAFDSPLPGISQTMRGDSAWSVLRVVDETGEVVSLSASASPKAAPGALTRQRLFAPVRQRRRFAYEVMPQMEGYAAARLPLGPHGEVSPGKPLELAWVDYLHDVVGSGALGLTGPLGPDAVTPGERPALIVGMLSVSPLGLFVQPSRERPDMVLLDRAGQPGPPMMQAASPAIRGEWSVRLDAVIAEGTPLALGLMQPGSQHLAAVATTPLSGTGSPGPLLLTTIAPPVDEHRITTTGFSYLGGSGGVTVHVIERDELSAWATFSPLDKTGRFGAALSLPTQLALDDAPQACTAAERTQSPRLLAPYLPGTRRPVMVTGSTDGYVLLTEWAVLHGTASAPCVAAWSAAPIGQGAPPMRAIIGGNPKQSWLFRATPGTRRAVDVRPMTCRLAPGGSIPKEIWAEPGTSR